MQKMSTFDKSHWIFATCCHKINLSVINSSTLLPVITKEKQFWRVQKDSFPYIIKMLNVTAKLSKHHFVLERVILSFTQMIT